MGAGQHLGLCPPPPGEGDLGEDETCPWHPSHRAGSEDGEGAAAKKLGALERESSHHSAISCSAIQG